MSAQRTVASLLLALALPLFGQQTPPPTSDPPHDISKVDTAPLGGIIAIPLPPSQQRRLRKYDLPELVGARQAIGSQLIDGQLPRPLIDYSVRGASIEQHLSIFRGGLAILGMSGAGGTMRKKVLLPSDAVSAYSKAASPSRLDEIEIKDVSPPLPTRSAVLRLYRDDGTHVEVRFDPSGVLPKALVDEIEPLEDLLRALSEDRAVTSSIAGYAPKVGDELVSDDRRIWRVERIVGDSGVVELRCTSQPTVIYVDSRYLYNYFIGKPSASQP